MDKLGKSVRDTAISQMCDGLRCLGAPEEEITKAKAEAIKTNSDRPLMMLGRLYLGRPS